MAWECRIDLTAPPKSETVMPSPMITVSTAQDMKLWPTILRISSRDIPTDARIYAQWKKACQELAEHETAVWLDDAIWDPTTPLRPPWPLGDPMRWDRGTPGAWDAATSCLTPEAGEIWWRRQTGSGPWVIGYVAIAADHVTLEDVSAALQVHLPEGAARVYRGDKSWWCAWRRTEQAPSGADWCQRMWSTWEEDDSIAVGVALVTTDPSSWPERLQRAMNLKATRPGKRIKSRPLVEQAAVRQQTHEQIAQIKAEEARRRAAEEARAAAEAHARQAAARLQAEQARLLAEAQELERQKAQLAEQRRQRDAQKAAALAEHVARLQAEVDAEQAALQAEPEPTDEITSRADASMEPPSPSVPHEPPETTQADAEGRDGFATDQVIVPPRRHRPTQVPSHWRPGQRQHWDAPTPVAPPKRSGHHPVMASPAEPPAPPSASLSSRPMAVRRTVRRIKPSRMASTPTPVPSSNPIGLPERWVAWVWGDDRKVGTSTTALAFARWLASIQSTPIRLLDGHLIHPGLGHLLYTGQRDRNPVHSGRGWESGWYSPGSSALEPPEFVTLMEGQLQIWLMGMPVKIPDLKKRWPATIQRMMDVALVVDGGLMAPPLPVDLPLMVMHRAPARPNVPEGTWIGCRNALPDSWPRTLKLPSEALGWEGSGSVAWADVWTPLMDTVLTRTQEGQG